jgi:hypothetical protein
VNRTDRGVPDSISGSGCPASAPSGACAREGERCLYGDDIRVPCRTVATCKGGSWSLQAPQCGNQTCSGTPETLQSTQCNSASDVSCLAAGVGEWCECLVVPGPPGATHWACFKPRTDNPAACPTVPPNLGQPCAIASEFACGYAAGGTACNNGYLTQCRNGIWQQPDPMPSTYPC